MKSGGMFGVQTIRTEVQDLHWQTTPEAHKQHASEHHGFG